MFSALFDHNRFNLLLGSLFNLGELLGEFDFSDKLARACALGSIFSLLFSPLVGVFIDETFLSLPAGGVFLGVLASTTRREPFGSTLVLIFEVLAGVFFFTGRLT